MKNGISDQQLRERIRVWKVAMPLPAHFQEKVWRQIESAEALSFQSVRKMLIFYIERLLMQKRVAFAYVTTLLVTGLVTGWWAASAKVEDWQAEAAGRYIQMVDPLQREMRN